MCLTAYHNFEVILLPEKKRYSHHAWDQLQSVIPLEVVFDMSMDIGYLLLRTEQATRRYDKVHNMTKYINQRWRERREVSHGSRRSQPLNPWRATSISIFEIERGT